MLRKGEIKMSQYLPSASVDAGFHAKKRINRSIRRRIAMKRIERARRVRFWIGMLATMKITAAIWWSVLD
jgi:hypothetical protein